MLPIIYAAEPTLTASFSGEIKEILVEVGVSTLLLTAFIAFLLLILVYHGIFSKTKYYSIVVFFGLLGSLLISVYSLNEKRVLLSQGRSEITPQSVDVSSITKESAIISWQTAERTAGFVKYGALPDRLDFISLDIRKNLPVNEHTVLLSSLQSDTVYYYVIVSDSIVFDKQGRPLTFTTSIGE